MADIPTPSEDDLKYLRIDPTDEARVAWLKGMLKSAWYGGLAEGHRQSAEALQRVGAALGAPPKWD
jgi:hypothetical protein